MDITPLTPEEISAAAAVQAALDAAAAQMQAAPTIHTLSDADILAAQAAAGAQSQAHGH